MEVDGDGSSRESKRQEKGEITKQTQPILTDRVISVVSPQGKECAPRKLPEQEDELRRSYLLPATQ